MRLFFLKIFDTVSETLNHPLKVLIFCLIFGFVNLVIEGSLLRLWSLHQEQTQLQEKRIKLSQQAQELSKKIDRASDPAFIEREARDRFDLVSEGDLVFVFSDGE